MRLPRCTALASLTAIAALTAPPAGLAGPILPGRCHMGVCGEMRLERKTPLRRNAIGRLFEVWIAGRSWPAEQSRPSLEALPFPQPTRSYVLCSTTRPAYVFAAGEGFSSPFLAHRLNPDGRSWFGYNHDDYPIYWATCHDLEGPEFFSPAMEATAEQLGYPGNLPQEQIEIDHPAELMQ